MFVPFPIQLTQSLSIYLSISLSLSSFRFGGSKLDLGEIKSSLFILINHNLSLYNLASLADDSFFLMQQGSATQPLGAYWITLLQARKRVVAIKGAKSWKKLPYLSSWSSKIWKMKFSSSFLQRRQRRRNTWDSATLRNLLRLFSCE